ncbi:aminopeptidase P N-terminal domain-containing protein [bacterium]|nr:aminopeptidase P N-terminal domain-containing protein [bacterium]
MLNTNIPKYFKQRRQQLVDSIDEGVFVFPSVQEGKGAVINYLYRQDSSFYYLSGFDEADACIVIVKTKNQHKFIVFAQDRDPKKELWDGERYGLKRIKEIFSADEVYHLSDLEHELPKVLSGHQHVYYSYGKDEYFDKRVFTALENLRKVQGRSGKGLLTLKDPVEVLGELRVIKKAEEIEKIKHACKASVAGHNAILSQAKPGITERQVEAIFEYTIKMNGCSRTGYSSIVASGANATCLHYVRNSNELKAGDLCLVDAGGEHDYYSADITRTFPVSGKFSQEQKEIYEVVLKAQKATISALKPGVPYENNYKISCEVMTQGLIDLGILQGSLEENLEKMTIKKFFPHNIGHWLGVDIHDVGMYSDEKGNSRSLQDGMFLTVEPGLYFNPEDDSYPEQYKGIGVRIEDDILITADGHENLTAGVPKEVEEIEAIRQEAIK